MVRIAVVPGDGVGPEVIAQGRRVLERAAGGLEWEEFPWGSDHYRRTGRMMPEDGIEILAGFEAIYFGAVGDPEIPDDVTLWGLILPIRKRFDQFVNYRPVRWLPGVPPRLAGRRPADVDMVFVRENVEGEYLDAGGRAYLGGPREVAVQTAVFTRHGVEQVGRFAFGEAARRRGKLASVTKSNALRHSAVLWDEVMEELAAEHPQVEYTSVLVDAAAYHMVIRPETFDVVVASNLFADVLTDLGAALQGSLGLAASANLDPTGRHPSMFEPVHGSAPDIAGRGIANPAGAIWAGALMLEHLGMPEPAARVMAALEATLAEEILTADLGGDASTAEFGDEVMRRLGEP